MLFFKLYALNNSMLENYIQFLKKRLKEELPGQKSHLKMAPMLGKSPYRGFKPLAGYRKSSVLVLLLPGRKNQIDILFTLRSDTLSSHRGQISFPGGKSESCETSEQTAIRETYEETGIHPEEIEVAGRLSSLYVPPSNSLIQPVAGFCRKNPQLKLNPDEVREAFTVPADTFLKKEILRREMWRFEDKEIEVPFWNVHKTPLWGATAMILSELIEIYSSFLFSKK